MSVFFFLSSEAWIYDDVFSVPVEKIELLGMQTVEISAKVSH